jgi:adenylate kinase
VALTGTPGTGKSSVAGELVRRGYNVIDLNSFAQEHGLFQGYDEQRQCRIYDLGAISERIERLRAQDLIIEGLISHLLPVDISIVLRCRPSVLEKRLRIRDYPIEKVRENMEAEALNVIACESRDLLKTYEIDTPLMGVGGVADSVERIIEGRGDDFTEKIDFIGEVIGWY